ncbi:MAG: putative porin [Thermodesulfobacteriota bacterium]
MFQNHRGNKMMKSFAGLTILLILAIPAYAEESVTIPLAEYNAIIKRLDAMQGQLTELDSLRKRVEELERHGGLPASRQPEEHQAQVTRDINTLYNSVDDLETKQAKNMLNFGGELRTRVDGYRAESYTSSNMNTFQELVQEGVEPHQAREQSTTYYESTTDNNNWTNRFRINMDAQISESLSFHGRLSMYKNWSDSDDGSSGDMLNDWNASHWPGSSNLWVDRAYVDWTPAGLPIPIALTVGRHPSSDGPPLEFKENRLRQSTYPGLIIDGEADGIVLTFGLEKLIGWKNTGLRFAYGKGYHSDDDSIIGTTFPFLDDSETGDSDMFAGFFESEIPGIKNSMMVLSYVRARDLPFRLGESANNLLDIPNQNVGDLDIWGAHFQTRDFLDSGLDFFLSYGGNRSRPNGNAPGAIFGLLSDDGLEPHSGYSLYGGLRYTLPYAPLNRPKLGFEYNHGSKYWFSMTMGTAELFNKLATRGDVYDVYYIQQVDKHLFFRLGYMHADYSHTRSGCYLTSPQPSNASLSNYYLLMDVRF